MTDYISREALRDALYEADAITMQGVKIINQFPAADVIEQKVGKWEQKEVFETFSNIEQLQSAFCPICKRYHTTPYSYFFKHYNFCPNCGTRMVDK